jgi:16S rRNA (adenine1518-N6/adenine1519-N6)-dimethyltransferase
MITPKKSLGQNFLRDDNIARKIIHALDLHPDDSVVEIGPGTGALTKHLLSVARRVRGIEVDKRAAAVLRTMFGETLELIEQDLLQVDLRALSQTEGRPLRVVGNIPYNLTSEILFWLFENRSAIDDATLMMQLEVARRLIAKPKTKAYGILSVAAQFYTQPEVLFTVSRNSFHPKPKVTSAVVRLLFHKQLPPCDIVLFTNVVRATFGKRRKTLRNGLRSLGCTDRHLASLRFDLNRRPEELSLDDFLALTSQLQPSITSLTLPFHAGRE